MHKPNLMKDGSCLKDGNSTWPMRLQWSLRSAEQNLGAVENRITSSLAT